MENEENKTAVCEAEKPVCCCETAEPEKEPCCCEAEKPASCCETAEPEKEPCCCEAEKPACCGEEKKTEFKRPMRPAIEITQEMLDETADSLRKMLDLLGLSGTVKAEKRTAKINLLISTDDAGRIIGRKGQSLESLQLLLNRIMQKKNIDYPKIYIDIDGYYSKAPASGDSKRHERTPRENFRRERAPREGGFRRERAPRFDSEEKEDILRQQAIDAAKEVRHWGEPVTLPLMNSHDRRIIHVTLENSEDVKTESIGEGAMKQVVISLKK